MGSFFARLGPDKSDQKHPGLAIRSDLFIAARMVCFVYPPPRIWALERPAPGEIWLFGVSDLHMHRGGRHIAK